MKNIKRIVYKSVFGFILFVFTVPSGCSGGYSGEGQIRALDEKELKKNPVNLLIIAEDRSGSTDNHRKLRIEDYEKLFKAFLKKGGGQISVRVIGNPSPAEREFFNLYLHPGYKHFEISDDMLMSEQAVLRKKNKRIDSLNNDIYNKNLARIKQFLENKIKPHVINYKPYRNRDKTDIADALKHIEMKINEPSVPPYQTIDVLIVSDGVHDAYPLKKPLQFNPKKKIRLYLVGWKDKTVFSGIPDIREFESIEGFIHYFANE